MKNIARFSIAFSSIAIISCLISIAYIHSEIGSAFEQIASDIKFFKNIVHKSWEALKVNKRIIKRETNQIYNPYLTFPKEQVLIKPEDEQVILKNFPPSPRIGLPPAGNNIPDACSCKTGRDNKCPRGPSGPKGLPGIKGLPGQPGIPGKPGIDADDLEKNVVENNYCVTCPRGPQGPPGPIGKTGFRGNKGRNGDIGVRGRDGHPGRPGEMGLPGHVGKEGPPGSQGERGHDARAPIGRPGLKGERGKPGPPGPQGKPGKTAPQGPQGIIGKVGKKGLPGMAGEVGVPGQRGVGGRPGRDLEYCPCPSTEIKRRRKSIITF